jgi:deferrochelatase/peroxidase EfeB
VAESAEVQLELEDIQSGVLRPRPTPYASTYIGLRIDDARAGRELIARIRKVVTSSANPTSPLADTWVSVALTYHGLKALAVPQSSLDSFAWEFRQGMAARAKELGDTGESGPENWEAPLGATDLHVVLVAVSPDEKRLEEALARARTTYAGMRGIQAIWRQEFIHSAAQTCSQASSGSSKICHHAGAANIASCPG